MRRVLVVAYHFPPTGTGGVGRALGWARHLPALGWQPTILAATPHPNWPRDESLLQQLPADVQVHRVSPWDPRPAAWRGLNHRELTFLWHRPALAAGRTLLRRTAHDLILATAPPPAAHAIASRLAGEFGIPWVADFRDPWGVRAPAFWRRRRRRAYLQSANAVIGVNETLCAHLEDSLRRPVHLLFNGYEPDEMPVGVAHVPRRTVFLGTLSEFNDFDTFFGALAELEGEFVHIGAVRGYDLAARTAAAGLSRVRACGYLPRADALREAATASVFLLSLKADLELALSAKTFDYIGLGGPILSVGDHGAAADFLRAREDLGRVVPAADGAQIRAALEQLFSAAPRLGEEQRREFARSHLAEGLARILAETVTGG
jgi:glycosyltransferase involved in cell wall biosynthesis